MPSSVSPALARQEGYLQVRTWYPRYVRCANVHGVCLSCSAQYLVTLMAVYHGIRLVSWPRELEERLSLGKEAPRLHPWNLLAPFAHHAHRVRRAVVCQCVQLRPTHYIHLQPARGFSRGTQLQVCFAAPTADLGRRRSAGRNVQSLENRHSTKRYNQPTVGSVIYIFDITP